METGAGSVRNGLLLFPPLSPLLPLSPLPSRQYFALAACFDLCYTTLITMKIEIFMKFSYIGGNNYASIYLFVSYGGCFW